MKKLYLDTKEKIYRATSIIFIVQLFGALGAGFFFVIQNLFQQYGYRNGAEAAGGRIKNGAEIAGENRSQKDSGAQHQDGIFGAEGEYREHRHDIGKTQFYTWQGDDRWNLGFEHENRQRNGCQQSENCQFPGFHGRYTPFLIVYHTKFSAKCKVGSRNLNISEISEAAFLPAAAAAEQR